MQFFKGDEQFSWRLLAVESLVIILSVFLGFMLNSWRLSQSQEVEVDTALRSIAAEMRYNKREMERHLPYYRAMVDTLRYLASVKGAEDTRIERSDIPGFEGYDIPILRASAFETARSTEALSNIDFELANSLFSYYRVLDLYTGLLEKLTSGLVMSEYRTIEDWWMVFILMAGNGKFVHNPRFERVMNRLLERYNMAKPDTARTDTAVRMDTTQTNITETDTIQMN